MIDGSGFSPPFPHAHLFFLAVDACYAGPCFNGATCTTLENDIINGTTNYTCTCVPGFTEYDCDRGNHLCFYYSVKLAFTTTCMEKTDVGL